MEIKTRTSGDVTIIDIEGRLDTTTAGDSAILINRIVAAGTSKLLINLQDVEFISTAGLRVLLRTSDTVKSGGGSVRVCHATGVVKEVIEIAGFDDILDVHETEEDAIASF